MISEETSGKTQQFRGGTAHPKGKDAPSAEFSGSYLEKNPQIQKSGLTRDHLGASTQVTPTSPRLSGSGEDTMTMPPSGSQPYDPLTNYLSPRPQFLHYNPKRLREIYLRRERELDGAEGDARFDLGLFEELENPSSERTVSGSPPLPSLGQEDGLDLEPIQGKESYESMGGEVDDTAEEERPWCCNLVWKVLLLLGILFSITGYISSMYSFSTLSSSKKFQSFKDNFLRIEDDDAPQETAGNIGMHWEEYSGTYVNTCVNVRFDELTTVQSGIGSSNFDGLRNFSEMGGEGLQEEGKPMVKDGSAISVDDVRSNANPVIIGGGAWSVGSGEELQDETQVIMSEDSDFSASNFSVMADGEGAEYAAYGKETQHNNEMIVEDDGYLVADNENLNAGMVVVEGENEGFDKVYDREHENRYTGDIISEENMEDVMVEAETEETGDVALKLIKPAEAPRGQTISGHEEDDGSSENGNDFNFYGMEGVTTVLVVLSFAASIACSFRRRREVKTSVKDSSGSFPSCGLSSESSFELPTVEKLEKDFDSLVNPGKFEDNENYPSAVDFLKEKLADSFVSTDKSEELYETHPPTVELLGEFSVTELGFPKTGDSSLGKKTAKANLHHSQSPDTPMNNCFSSVDQSPSELSTTESTQEKLGRKQNNRRKHGAEEAVSTPLRRSSRIRTRVTSP